MNSERARKILEKLRTSGSVLSGRDLEAIRQKAERDYRPIPLDEAIRGKPLRTSAGPAWLVENPASAVQSHVRSLEKRCRRIFNGASLALPEESYHPEVRHCLKAGLEKMLFIDIETTGLYSAMIFLAGTMRWTPEGFLIRQFFARDYPEEPAVLRAVAREAKSARVIITFNGKTFDVPSLQERARYHRLEFPWRGAHCDLLHEARRQWKHLLPNCRLKTLEALVCGTPRGADIPSAEIPQAYHDYAKTGDARKMTAIVTHNAHDLLAMADILASVIEGRVPEPGAWADFA